MIHIHGGDCSADRARSAGIAGEHLPWREALVVGPARLSLRPSWLAQEYGADPSEQARDTRRVREALHRANGHDELTFWFDDDLFCQVNLWFLLSEIAGTRKRVNLRGASPLSSDQVSAGAAAWRAYCSATPLDIEQLIRGGSQFGSALRLHLTRYPSTFNGLGAVEMKILQLVSRGGDSFDSLFRAFSEEAPEFGFGDAQIRSEVARLSSLDRTLLQARDSQLSLTREGAEVLAGDADFVELNGIDLWLGGVHLSGAESPWRWSGRELVATSSGP